MSRESGARRGDKRTPILLEAEHRRTNHRVIPTNPG